MSQSTVGSHTTFAIVGSGWRAHFFARLAAVVPERFRVAGVVTRSADRAATIAQEWGIAAYTSIDDLLAAERPDYVIVSVPWDASPDAIRSLVERHVRVLAETPPAADVDGLRRLWSDVGATGLVQVAEQYMLMPGHAARLALVRSGIIGSVGSVQVSSTHMYHAVSMIRAFLGLQGAGLQGGGLHGAGFHGAGADGAGGRGDASRSDAAITYPPAEVHARAFVAPLADPLSPAGWSGDDTPKLATTTLATIDFGGRSGLYDFTDNQWWNPLRARRIVIRGSRGEIVDDVVTRLLDPTTPISSALTRRQTGHDLNLEGLDLKYISFDGTIVYTNPFAGSGMSDDDIAVAAILEATGAWARNEASGPYPLGSACEDHLIALAIEQSVRAGRSVTTTDEPWSTANQ